MDASSLRGEDEEGGRETRLRLLLLAVAVLLVLGYAASVTDMGAFLAFATERVTRSAAWVEVGRYVAAALAIAAAGYAVHRAVGTVRRRASSVPDSAPGDRKAFKSRLGAQLDRHRALGRQLAVHLIDIDRFRQLNEALGELEGDAFLRLVGQRLLVLVDDPGRLARIGDDEFVVIQPDAGGPRHAEIFARRLAEVLRDVCAQVPPHARPSASIGIAVFPDHGDDADRLLASASLALHAVKRAGGNDMRLHAPDPRSRSQGGGGLGYSASIASSRMSR